MNNPDFRALCAELLAAADEYAGMNPYMRLDNAMKAARAALAQPAPAQPEPVAVVPTDDELRDLWSIRDGIVDLRDFVIIARAVLAKWGTPATDLEQLND